MNLLITGAFNYAEEQIDKIKSLGYKIIFIQDERLPILTDVSNIDAIVCNGLFLNNDISKFKNLKYLQITSTGLDRVPLDYITENGISFFNAKGIYSIPMAEWVILKILEIYKRSTMFYTFQKMNEWNKQRDLLELTGKNVAIVGFGSVGTEIAKRLKGFGVKIIAVSRRILNTELIDEHFLIDDINEALIKSDIVILTLPLTEDTYHLINSLRISNMKNKSVLINVSRGGIIDENALLVALKNGKFLGVALDVFEEEPLSSNSPFWNLTNVIITPHNSYVSEIVPTRMFNLIYENLKEFKTKQ
jgi:phosphoglycerate dehydrogenase-like enzyme